MPRARRDEVNYKYKVGKMQKIKMFLIIKDESERVKGKNFRDIDGLPLHEYFIKRRGAFDIYIDTDSQRILDFYSDESKWPNVTVYKRLQKHIEIEAAGDVSPASLMIERFLNEYVVENEIVVTSHITSPFIKDHTINQAIGLMDIYDSVSSVLSVQEFVVQGVGSRCEPINFDPTKIVKTQSLQPIGVLNGAFFIIRKNIFLKNGLRRISDNHFYFQIDPIQAIDIDTEDDLFIARCIAKGVK